MDQLRTQDEEMLASNRQKNRESIFLGANLLFKRTGEEVAVRVRNISAGGMMVDCTLGANIGDEVEADIKNVGRVLGHVAWSVSPRIGIAFEREINPARARLKV